MSDFKDTVEVVEYCKSGGRVQYAGTSVNEGFDEDGVWSYSNGNPATLGSYKHYSKYIPSRKTKKVKLLAYLINSGEMKWLTKDKPPAISGWHRVPSEDKEIEIEIEE